MNDNSLNYKKILCPVDFSACSRRAFYVAMDYSKQFDAETILLHVREHPLTADGLEQNEAELIQLEEGIRRRLDLMVSQGNLTPGDRKRLELEIRGGKPWVEILEFAEANGVDLIIMGTHGSTGLIKSILIGSQAERVVRRATCHVLVVKPEDFESSINPVPERFRV